MFAEVVAWEAPPGGARVREHAVPAVPSGAFSPLPALPPLGGPGRCVCSGGVAPGGSKHMPERSGIKTEDWRLLP
jgi:hypothetical protein